MNSGYYPQVVNPHLRVQTQSQQPTFYFGGSQVPINLNINENPKRLNLKTQRKIYNLK